MEDDMAIQPEDRSFAVHPEIDKACPVCGVAPKRCCEEDGEEFPPWEVHVGRVTGGADLVIQHTGTFDETGAGIFHVVGGSE